MSRACCDQSPARSRIDRLVSVRQLTQLVLKERRLFCSDETCVTGNFTEQVLEIASEWTKMIERARRWVTERGDRLGRTVAELTREPGL